MGATMGPRLSMLISFCGTSIATKIIEPALSSENNRNIADAEAILEIWIGVPFAMLAPPEQEKYREISHSSSLIS
jgi:hypothetical protein